jgi:hypothetical protein
MDSFGVALTETLAAVDVVAKSMQRPCKVHFSLKNNGHSCFPAGYPSTNCHLFIPSIMTFWLAAGKELGDIILQHIN